MAQFDSALFETKGNSIQVSLRRLRGIKFQIFLLKLNIYAYLTTKKYKFQNRSQNILILVYLCRSQNFLLLWAMLNLLKKGLGRSKPATHPWTNTNNTTCGDFYYIQSPRTVFYRLEQNKHYKPERVRLFILDWVQFAYNSVRSRC